MPDVVPPPTKKMLGRPKKKRRLEPWEVMKNTSQLGQTRLKKKCGICHKLGHNRKSCIENSYEQGPSAPRSSHPRPFHPVPSDQGPSQAATSAPRPSQEAPSQVAPTAPPPPSPLTQPKLLQPSQEAPNQATSTAPPPPSPLTQPKVSQPSQEAPSQGILNRTPSTISHYSTKSFTTILGISKNNKINCKIFKTQHEA